ncbi:RNase H domain-containing protein [Trichonephila clavipes]|nr:RNase H domain-containing protein [Trichonephila clavipes]
MAPHKPRKSATTDYTTDDEVLIMSVVQEEELESDKFAIKEWPQNFPKGFLRALTPTRGATSPLVRFVEGKERSLKSGVKPSSSMVLKATANDRRHLALCLYEFRGPWFGLCRSGGFSNNNCRKGLVIFSDSESGIEAIRNGETNISCDIITLLKQLHSKRKSCIVQWIPAHVNIESNECADSLAKEARDIDHKCTTITLDDANAVAKHRIMNHTFKKPLVTEFDCPRIITSTIARLRTEHLKGMKIHPEKTRSYVQCKHCPDLELTPNHILECLTVATKLLKMGMVPLRDSLREILYSPDVPRIAEAVIKTFDGI